MPDIPTRDNIGNFYRPRRAAWLTLLQDIKQTSYQTLAYFFPSSSNVRNTHLELQSLDKPAPPPVNDEYKKKVQTAFALLAESATHLNPDALYALGDMNFYGNYTHTQDFAKSLECYKTLATLTGNTTAQFMVGLMYSTGMFGHTPINQAKANLYYTFAANSGDSRAQMAMGFRHLSGIGTPVNTQEALKYYKDTADKSFEYFFEGSAPGGRFLAHPSWILPNDNGGVYGEGASYSSSGHNARHDYPTGVRTVEEAIEYFHYLAEENNVVYAHLVLAMLYFDGGKTLEPDFKMAVEYARRGAAYLWRIDGSPNPMRSKLEEFAIRQGAHCAGFVGSRYMKGQGVPQNFEKAKMWFLRGIEFSDYISYNSLGFMYYHGIGVEKDMNLGVSYIKKAADMKYGPAHFNLGYAYYQRNQPGDQTKAYDQFDLASKKRNFPASYYKGLMLYTGFPGKERSVDGAVVYFKLVSDTVEELHSPLKWAHEKFAEKDYGSAMLGFLIGAEQGYETAQMNLAYLLDEQRGYIDLGSIKEKALRYIKQTLPFIAGPVDTADHKPKIRNMPREKTALVYWTRAARLMNIDAIVKMGDYYFNGIGTEKPDPAKAAACYQAAADHPSSLAKWNLGWMHENGIGAEQSYHLAKRYYDLAAATTPEAFFPVQLALLRLRVRSFWSSLTSGKSRSSEFADDDSSEDGPAKSFREGLLQMWRYWRDATPPDHRRTPEDDEAQATKIWDDGESSSSIDDVENLEDSLDSLLVFTVITIFGAVMWYRQRQQARLQQELRQRAEQQRLRQQNGEAQEGDQNDNLQQENNNNRFMFQAGDGWVGFQFRAGF